MGIRLSRAEQLVFCSSQPGPTERLPAAQWVQVQVPQLLPEAKTGSLQHRSLPNNTHLSRSILLVVSIGS